MPAPSSLLRAGGLDPVAVAARCGLADVDAVAVRAAPRWMVQAWIGPVTAMTLRSTIYVRPDVLAGEPGPLARLLAHELVHARQWRELGVPRFLGRYLGEYLRARFAGRSHADAYHGISLEREADALSRLPGP